MAKGGSKKSKQFTVELTGDKAFMAKLRRVLKEAPEIIAQFLTEEAETIMTESKKQCPVDTGALRSQRGTSKLPRFNKESVWLAA